MLMTAPLTDHTLKVTDLLERPGASREVALRLPAPEELELPLASLGDPLRLDGVIESVVEGLLVRGALRAPLGLECARCLRPVERAGEAEVVELFVDPARLSPDDEVEPGYEIDDGHIDLATLLRDALVAMVPYRPLCREACQGLCAECGADLNQADCGCADVAIDDRWEALRGLRLPDSRS